MNESSLCGEPTEDNGTPCLNPAGYGVPDRDSGPCLLHLDEQSVVPKGNEGITMFTGEKKATIITTMRDGFTKRMAAERAGVSLKTIERWLGKGEEQESLPPSERDHFYEFYTETMAARSEAKERLLREMHEAGQEDWRMYSWKAEQLYPKDFGDRQFDDSGNAETTVTHKVETDIGDDEREFLEQLWGEDDDDVIDVESGEEDSNAD